MKKLIPFLVICLAVLCFFSSCGAFETIPVEGTWKVDYTEERGTSKYDYYTLNLVFSGNEVQLIKKQYGDSARTNLLSTDATEKMPYTLGEDGVVTANHGVGLANTTYVTETFTLDKTGNKLIWKQGVSGKKYTLDKESSDTAFSTPSLGSEEYKYTAGIEYYNSSLSSGVIADKCKLTLNSDGTYEIEYVNSGRWEKSTDNPNKITLTASDSQVFSRMVIEYDALFRELTIIEAESTNSKFSYEKEEDPVFGFYSSWYIGFYY